MEEFKGNNFTKKYNDWLLDFVIKVNKIKKTNPNNWQQKLLETNVNNIIHNPLHNTHLQYKPNEYAINTRSVSSVLPSSIEGITYNLDTDAIPNTHKNTRRIKWPKLRHKFKQ